MAKYSLRQKAVEDLAGIWDYTCEKWSEKQADTYYMVMIAAFNDIAENPAAGKPYAALGERIRGRRIGNHLIIYRTGEENSVEVLRILPQRMDLRAWMHE